MLVAEGNILKTWLQNASKPSKILYVGDGGGDLCPCLSLGYVEGLYSFLVILWSGYTWRHIFKLILTSILRSSFNILSVFVYFRHEDQFQYASAFLVFHEEICEFSPLCRKMLFLCDAAFCNRDSFVF